MVALKVFMMFLGLVQMSYAGLLEKSSHTCERERKRDMLVVKPV